MKNELKKLKYEMRCTCILLYFFRNNSRYTNRYYFSFIEILGPEKYLYSPFVRNEWDGARYSFDKMYGLVSAWSKNFKILDCEQPKYDDINSCVDEFCEKEISKLRSRFDKVSKGIFELAKVSKENDAKKLTDCYIEINEKITDIEKKIKDVQSKEMSDFAKLNVMFDNVKKITEIHNELIDFSLFIKEVSDENNKNAGDKMSEKTIEKNSSETNEASSTDASSK